MVKLRIKEVMREKGIGTQKELADMLCISNANLSAILKRTPSLDTLQRIADALGVEITELFVSNKSDRVGEELTTTDFKCPHCKKALHIHVAIKQ